MKGRLSRAIFWALIGTFIATAGWFFFAANNEIARGASFEIFLITSGVILVLLGTALIIITVKEKATGLLKISLILTGAGAIGIPVSIVLHNAIYALFVYFSGEGFWDRIGLGDEPFFFIMAIVVCPLGFLIGAVGSIVLTFRRPE